MRFNYNSVANSTGIWCEDVEIEYVVLWSLYSTPLQLSLYQKLDGLNYYIKVAD